MTVAELRAKLTSLQSQMAAIQQTADNEKRMVTADEAKKIAELDAEFQGVKNAMDAKMAIERVSASLEQTAGRRTLPGAAGVAVGAGAERDPRGGFANLAEFAMSVQEACRNGGRVDQRLARARSSEETGAGGIQAAPAGYMTETSGADQGYLVPPEMRSEIWSLIFDGDDLINLVTVEPTGSNAVEWLGDETTPWGSSGVKAKWRAEAQQMVSTGKPVQQPRMLRLDELYAFVTASEELLEDAPRLNSRLTMLAARAIRWELSESIINGSGVGKPKGWMKSGALATVSAEAGQATATIVLANLTKMYSRLLYMGAGRATWLGNREIFPALAPLTIGQNGIFFLPQTGATQSMPMSIFGTPMRFNEHCKALGTSGDIQLCDLDGYYAVQKAGGVKLDTSIHLYFDYGLQAFRWTIRFAGQPFLSAPMTPANGTNTRSHFVTLADRP